MDYLQNDICKFKVVYGEMDPNKKKNFFVSSLFKMRNGGYKNFNKYLQILDIIDEFLESLNTIIPEKLYLRLFIDSNIYNDNQIMDKLKKVKDISLILFTCSDFIIQDKYHVSVFGTLIRFFPLFDFPNNDAKHILITDMDSTIQVLFNRFNFYFLLLKNANLDNLKIGYIGRYFNDKTVNQKIIDNHIYPYCLATKIIGINRINKEVFIKFLNKLKPYMFETKNKIYSDYFISEHDLIKRCERNICFGVDEYFLNRKLIKYLKKNNLEYCYLITNNLAQYYYFFHKDSQFPLFDNKTSDESKKMRGEIFNNYLKKIGYNDYSFTELDELLTKDFISDIKGEEIINPLDLKAYTNKLNNYKINKVVKVSKFVSEFADKFRKLIKYVIKKGDNRVYNKYIAIIYKMCNFKNYFYKRYIRFINSNNNKNINLMVATY